MYEDLEDSDWLYFTILSNNTFNQVKPPGSPIISTFIYLGQESLMYFPYLIIENNTFIGLNLTRDFFNTGVPYSAINLVNNIWINLKSETLMKLGQAQSGILQNNLIVDSVADSFF